MNCDDLKIKTMQDQPEQRLNARKARGPPFLSSRWWCLATVTLGILCLGLLVTLIIQKLQLSQALDLLKQQQENITHQENILEGQMLAQQQAEEASQESQKELKDIIKTLADRLDEKATKLTEVQNQNLNLQEVLKRAANFSGIYPESQCSFQFPILDGAVSQEIQ
ncbi:oxidized low-density lipoprotein receptor 1 isoform X1 [Tenrec ecaudatus]|uniref:oxidized low-density lipoprotein receptor 1 isoform X1 n=1 Tax=Tenrec ecaudatus TaxID=94439 RepID=UPI003F59B405